MATVYKLKCPDCAETFRWPGNQRWPEFCPHCQARVANDTVEIKAPFISTSGKTKATDKVYRDMEAGSVQRANMAAEMLGVPASDMSDLKITDLRSTKIPGSVAAAPVSNTVSQFMDQHPGVSGFQGGGVEYSGAVQSGPAPNSGARFMQQWRQVHANKYGHNLVTDNPANETLQPGYRRRG